MRHSGLWRNRESSISIKKQGEIMGDRKTCQRVKMACCNLKAKDIKNPVGRKLVLKLRSGRGLLEGVCDAIIETHNQKYLVLDRSKIIGSGTRVVAISFK